MCYLRYMSSTETPTVPVDVLPPVPRDAQRATQVETKSAPFENYKTFYHPASGVVILGLDWLAFGTDALTGFLALPEMCVLAFMASFAAVLAIQLKWSKDKMPTAMGKAFLGAFLVGLPTPITGTMLGAAILALSGLPHHPVDVLRRLAARK